MAGLLPNGLATLHHPGCGCPPGWEAGGAAGRAALAGQYRPADLVDALLQRAFRAYQQGSITATRKLRVAYMLPHHNITGGMKCLVEHIRLLRERGHVTIAVHRSDTAAQAMPPWSQERADVDVVCRLHQRLSDVYPAQDIDVCVVGIFHQVAELLMGVPAPVMYWEQGHEWVFGDEIRFQEAHNYRKQDQLFHMVMHLPCAMVAVSEAVQAILEAEFGRASLIIPNGIDCHRFTPGPRSTRQPSKTIHCTPGGVAPAARAGERSVLLVGNPALPLKAFPVALAALATVNQVSPIRVTWVCQVEPSAAQLPGLPSCGLTIDLHVSPPQGELAGLYRGHDVLLFTSRYEAWGMPVMEGMASGLAVVATRCLGVATFAHHAHNCLLADPGDVGGLAAGVLRVLGDESLRTRLALEARHTALHYTPEDIAERLEAVLYSLTAVSSEVLSLRQPALSQLQVATAWASTACAKVSDQQRFQQYQAAQLARLLSVRANGQLSTGSGQPRWQHSPPLCGGPADGDPPGHLHPSPGTPKQGALLPPPLQQDGGGGAPSQLPGGQGRIRDLQCSYQQLRIGGGGGSGSGGGTPGGASLPPPHPHPPRPQQRGGSPPLAAESSNSTAAPAQEERQRTPQLGQRPGPPRRSGRLQQAVQRQGGDPAAWDTADSGCSAQPPG